MLLSARLGRRIAVAGPWIAVSALLLAACTSTAAPPAQPTVAAAPPAQPTATTAAAQPMSAPTAAKPAATAQPASLTPLVIGYDGQSMTSGPLNYAAQQGIFKQYGIDPDLRYVSGGSTLTAGIVGGSIPIAQNGYEPSLTAAMQGADVVLIGGISNSLPFQLIVKPELAREGALKGSGAKIAISRFGSSSDVAARAVLKHLGVDPANDVAILQIGGEPERVAAMESGQIDGTVLQYPSTGMFEKRGYKVIGNASDVVEYPNTAYVTSRKYLKEHREMVKDFLKAIVVGIHAYKTQPEPAIKATATFLKAPVEEVKPAYDYFTKSVYPDVPKPTIPGIKALLENQISTTVPAAKTAKPEDLVDTTLFDELEREGFFKEVLGR